VLSGTDDLETLGVDDVEVADHIGAVVAALANLDGTFGALGCNPGQGQFVLVVLKQLGDGDLPHGSPNR